MTLPVRIVLGLMLTLCSHVTITDLAQAGQTVVVVLDDSGSMERRMLSNQRRMEAAKEALNSVLRGLPFDTKVGVLALNSMVNGSHWIVPIGSPDPNRWSQALAKVRAKGGTFLGQHMREAADELLKLRAAQPYDTYRLLVVTDGEASDAPMLASILPDLMSRGLVLDVIGVDMSEDHSLALSSHSYRRAGDRESLEKALGEVFAETAVNDQSNASDFEMLSGLSEETASAIVKGLTVPRNDPIQEARELAAVVGGPVNFNTPGSIPQANQPGSTMGKAVSVLFSTLCCLGSVGFVLLVVISVILNAVKNQTRS